MCDDGKGIVPIFLRSTSLLFESHLTFSDSFGGFEYGYQQGVLGQSLVMTRFKDNFPSVVASSSATGWLTSILQLGGILGSLSAGVLGEVFSRKYTMFSACCWVILGSYLYCGATYHNPAMLYAGRFFTGLGVGTFSGVGYANTSQNRWQKPVTDIFVE